MRQHFLAAALFALSLAACVTADDVGSDAEAVTIEECPPDVLNRPQFEHVILGGATTLEQSGATDDPRNSDPTLIDGVGGTGDMLANANARTIGEDAGACGCTDNGCVIDWISENVGCDVCVDMICDGAFVGGCVPCIENTDEPSAAQGCVIADPGSFEQ